ncbi:hypothetical protein ACOMHN_025896 [Nucella lapillus]
MLPSWASENRLKLYAEYEIKVFLSLVITTGPIIKPTIEDYWSQEDITYTPFSPKNMSLVRFQAILSNFHIADNMKMMTQTPVQGSPVLQASSPAVHQHVHPTGGHQL